jgi:hypothetical protein
VVAVSGKAGLGIASGGALLHAKSYGIDEVTMSLRSLVAPSH